MLLHRKDGINTYVLENIVRCCRNIDTYSYVSIYCYVPARNRSLKIVILISTLEIVVTHDCISVAVDCVKFYIIGKIVGRWYHHSSWKRDLLEVKFAFCSGKEIISWNRLLLVPRPCLTASNHRVDISVPVLFIFCSPCPSVDVYFSSWGHLISSYPFSLLNFYVSN